MIVRASAAGLLSGAIAIIASSGLAYGQSPADEFAREQARRQRIDRLKDLAEQTPEAAAAAALPATLPGDGACFPVDRVAVEGVTRLPPAEITTLTASHQGRCLGLAEFQDLLRQLTALYLDRGYIAARVYLPEQDIVATRTLRLVAIEGQVTDVYVDGKPAGDDRLAVIAFPGLIGKPANLRDIEQGLDQVNRLSSLKATTEMLPGVGDGASILNVAVERTQPWHISVSNSNLGQEQTGLSKSAVSLRFDNLFDLYELSTFGYEHSGPDYPGDSDGFGSSDSYSGSLSLPYGYWTFGANGSWYEYNSATPGNFSTLRTSGSSGQLGLTVDRVLHRGQQSLTELNAALTYKQTDNYLMGNLIEVGSRRYTVGSLGLSHSTRLFGGLWVFDASFDQGLDLFNAVDAGEPGAGSANPNFSKLSATIAINRPFDLGSEAFETNLLVAGQYSPDLLFGAEQMALGSYANVRGSRESLIFGNNGIFIRSEISWRTLPWAEHPGVAKLLGELRPYVGLDYGRIFRQRRFDIEGGDLLSATIGARLAGGGINLDFGYSDILAFSAGPRPHGLLFVNASLNW